jgi:hypothetical protein
VPGSVAQNEIGPRNKLAYFLEFPGVEPPTSLRVDIKWVSDNGIRSTNLGYINLRQQLEFYKKENLKTTSMPENGPRMEAYTKFVEIMSVRPIDVHYAPTKIVPRFETILLLSSPEVKRIAKAICDEEMAGGKIKNMPGFVHRINEELIPVLKTEIEKP